MTANNQPGVAGGVDVLALVRAQAEAHRNNAAVDAYDAQQAPKWEAALATVEAMAEALVGLVHSLAEQDDEGLIEHAEPMQAAREALRA